MKTMLALIVALLGMTSAAVADEPAPAQKQQATGEIVPGTIAVASPQWKSEKLVCHKQEVIGSLIQSKRVCATPRDWARQQQAAQDNLGVLIAPGAYNAK